MKLTFLIVLAVFVAGCAATPQSLEIDGSWQLVSGEVGGRPLPLVDGRPITLQIAGNEVSGTSSCNQYGGQIVVDGTAIRFGDLMTTLMGCEAELMEAESAFTDAIRRVDNVAIDGADLVLAGPDVELRFTTTS